MNARVLLEVVMLLSDKTEAGDHGLQLADSGRCAERGRSKTRTTKITLTAAIAVI